MGKSTSSSSKKRSRAPEEDVVDSGDSTAAVKKSKIDASGKSEVTKNGAVSESPAKKEKKDKKDKEGKKEKKSKDVKVADAPEVVEVEVVEEKKAKKEKKSKDGKKDKKDKKSKKDKTKDADEDVEMTNGHSTPAAPETNGDAPAAAGTPSKKSKKDKKDKKDKKEKSKKSKSDSNGTTQNGDDSEPAAAAADDDKEEPEATTAEGAKATRFICFIGNLPYSATVESITAHFATVHPTSVRMLTERENPAKSKGIAFVEFGRFDHMKTCLEKFHHTEFDDGVSPARKINVELTAGGGGKTDKRTEKIAAKNKKLNEERAQRMAKEENAKLEKAAKKPAAEAAPQEDPAEVGWIHPSRLGRVPHEDQTQEQRDEDLRNATDEQPWDNGPGKKFGGGGRGRGGRGGGRGRGAGRGGGGRGGGRGKKW